jgi:hypothetical protein
MMVVGALLLAGSAATAMTVSYGWENGGTILGSFGNLVDPLNVATGSDPWPDPSDGVDLTVTPHEGAAMLKVTESPHSSTPQAHLAYVEGISNDDQVIASFYGWDVTDGASPSLRIWGHYADSTDGYSYKASASGNLTYTTGTPEDPWSQVDHTWTIALPEGADTLVLEARLYSTPSTADPASTDYWIDDLSVTVPDGATVSLPVPEPSLWGILLGLIAGGLLARWQR